MNNIDFMIQIKKLKKERETVLALAKTIVADEYIDISKFEEHILNTDKKKMLHEGGLGEKLYASEPYRIGGSVLFEALA